MQCKEKMCPKCPASSVEYTVVYTDIKVYTVMTSVLTFDEAIYCKVKEIQWNKPEDFSSLVFRFGDFLHTTFLFPLVLWKRFKESGIENLLVESNVYGVSAIINDQCYNRAIRAYKPLM